MNAPNVTIVTIMKDEGPFILEWIAWNQMIGVTDFIVMTNDCSDGTDLMLDRLHELGHLTHLPNPIVVTKDGSPHGVALKYAQHLAPYRAADWILHTDVDEFLCLAPDVPDIPALIDACGEVDAISISETLFGCSGVDTFVDAPIVTQFTHAMRQDPKEGEARRGVKTLFRNEDIWRGRHNHRPVVRKNRLNTIRWADGSGAPAPEDFVKGKEPGMDCDGRYNLAALHHYSVRSLDSFLAKLHRGDAVKSKRTRAGAYWRKRNQNTVRNEAALTRVPELQKRIDALKADAALNHLHEQAVATHQDRIAQMRKDPEMAEIIAYMSQYLWGHPDFAK
ncbi:MAG: glycosyltransferase family 2 protein [Pikeienuella sp.]